MRTQPSTWELADQIHDAKLKVQAQRLVADEALEMLEVERQRVEAELSPRVVGTFQVTQRTNRFTRKASHVE